MQITVFEVFSAFFFKINAFKNNHNFKILLKIQAQKR